MGQVSAEGMSHFVDAESDPRSGGWRLILTHVNRETEAIGAVWFGRDSSAKASKGGADKASGINAGKPPRCDVAAEESKRGVTAKWSGGGIRETRGIVTRDFRRTSKRHRSPLRTALAVEPRIEATLPTA